MAKAIFKFNNGNFALLCSDCNVIIKTGKDFTEKEWAAVEGTNNLEDRKSTRLNSSHSQQSRMPSSA